MRKAFNDEFSIWIYCFILICVAVETTRSDSAAGGGDPAGSPSSDDVTDGIPVFVQEPQQHYYIIKHKAVRITCAAAPAVQINFKCAGQWVHPDHHANEQHVRPDGRRRMQTSIEVSRREVEEYYGLDGYWCECHAWNSVAGQRKPQAAKSRRATVQVAYIRKRFEREPISTAIELEKSAQLQCLPPIGLPTPEVFWLKDSKMIDVMREMNFIISNEGNLIVNQARLSDAGNYTCVAKNVASKRMSDAASLIVYVNGQWSSWRSWGGCSNKCGKGVQKRTRTCTDPVPLNGGKPCMGEATQRVPCTSVCPVTGVWSTWSSWSTCSPDCRHHRRRLCDNPAPQNGGHYCNGNDLDTANCTGGSCKGHGFDLSFYSGNEISNKPHLVQERNVAMYVGIIVAIAVLITVIIIIVFLLRRKNARHRSFEHDTIYIGTSEKKLNKSQNQNFYPVPPDLTQTMVALPPSAHLLPQHQGPTLVRQVTPAHQHLLMQTTPSSADSTPNNNHVGCVPLHGYAPSNTSDEKLSLYFENGTLKSNGKNIYMDVSSANPTPPPSVTSSSAAPNERPPPVPPPLVQRKEVPGAATGVDQKPEVPARPGSALQAEPAAGRAAPSCALPPNVDMDALAWAAVTHKGARLALPESGVSVIVPYGAIEKGTKEEIFVAVCRDDKDRPKLSESQTMLGPVMLIGPRHVPLKKPLIVSFQHCASVRHGQWSLHLYNNDASRDEPSRWQNLSTLGHETINTPAYVQVDVSRCHVMSDALARFTLIGEPLLGGKAFKILRLAAYAPLHAAQSQPHGDFNIRVYFVEDTQDALETVQQVEQKLGGCLLDRPQQILFQYGGANLCLAIEELGAGWRSKVAANYQEIPFGHIWSGTQSGLHCSFAIEQVDRAQPQLTCKIHVFQKQLIANRQVVQVSANLNELPSASATSQHAKGRSSKVHTLDGRASSVQLDPPDKVFRLSSHVREKLCKLLDPPNNRGNDWRMLAQRLSVDRYINYFATKTSPTDHILDLWEARHREDSAITDLMNSLRVMGRIDAASIIEKEAGSWL